MNKLWIIFVISCLGAILKPSTTHSTEWKRIYIPQQQKQILLELKARTLHRIPQILVYSEDQHQQKKQIGLIDLNEDNRNRLSLTHRWLNHTALLLEIHCDACMLEKRAYVLHLKESKIVPYNAATNITI
jgi:hypothetical protein